MTHSPFEPDPQQSQNQPPKQTSEQAQDVRIGGNFHVDGQANQVDFSQTYIDKQIFQITVEDVKHQALNTNSPYKGLKKFEADDKDCFFGREPLIQDLVEDLQQRQLILLLGASGSGKSSVIQAGLIPKLREVWGASFIELTVKPDRDPFMGLFVALVRRGFSQAQAETVLAGTPETLVQMVTSLRTSQTPWLLYVDQFEELFTMTDPQKRDAFLQSLVKLHQFLEQSKDRFIKLVMTMRTDFLDSFSAYPSLNSMTQGHLRLLDKMDNHQLKLAIAQPAARHGVVFEANLVEEIIEDLRDQAGALPLLQYTLDLLWRSEDLKDRTLHIQTYRALGGVQGALQKHVNEIYSKLTPDEQEAVKRIFIRLVNISPADKDPDVLGKAVRRRAHFSDFKDASIQSVLIKLINANLLVSDRPAISIDQVADSSNSGLSTIEVAHETLFSSWPTLRTWIEDSKEVILLKNRLKDDASRWNSLLIADPEGAEGELWRGKNLQRALELTQEHLFDLWYGGLDKDEQQFISASQELRDRAQREREERLKREKELYRRTAVGAIASLIAITGIAIVAGFQWRAADRGQLEALITSTDAQFDANKFSLDSLLSAIKTGRQFQQSFWFGNDPQIRAKVLEVLGQSVYWVKERNRLEGHNAIVRCVSFSPDGQFIATGGSDNSVVIWDTTGRQVNILKGHTAPVLGISFSRDGKMIATASEDKTVKLWNLEGKIIRTIPAHNSPVPAVSFGTNNVLATVGDDGFLKLWSIQGENQHSIPAHTNWILGVTFSPDGSLIATASADNTVKLWDSQANLLHTLTGHTDAVFDVAFSNDGLILASAGRDGVVRLWDNNGKFIRTLKDQNSREMTSVSISNNGYIVAGNIDGDIQVWDQVGKLITTLKGHTNRVNDLTFALKKDLLASASRDQTVRLWQLYNPLAEILGHDKDILDIAFNSSGNQLITASRDQTVTLWDVQRKISRKLDGHKNIVSSVDFSPNGKNIASGSLDGTVRLWNLQGELLKEISADEIGVQAVRFNPQSDRLATSGEDKIVKLWNLQGKLIQTFEGHKNDVYSLSFSPDGKKLATASGDATARVWDINGNLLYQLIGHKAGVLAVSFSRDGKYIATASRDHTIRLWDSMGRSLRAFEQHTAPVLSISFSPNSQWIVSTGEDQTVRLWNLDGTLVTTLSGYSGIGSSVVFSPDGRAIALGGSDGLLIWKQIDQLNLDNLLKQGCEWIQDYSRNHSKILSDC